MILRWCQSRRWLDHLQVSYGLPRIFELRSCLLDVQETNKRWDQLIRIWIHYNEAVYQIHSWLTIKASHNGDSLHLARLYLWWQSECSCQTNIPDSTLKNKSQSIAYHFVREGAACDEWSTAYVNTCLNLADLLTKPLPSGDKQTGCVRMILHYIFGWFYLCFESGLDVPMVEPLILCGGF